MSDGGPQGPERGRVTDGGRPSGLAVGLGVLAGFAAAFFFPLLVIPMLDQLPVAQANWALQAAIFGPAALGLLVLLVPSWRRSGAGFVMGLAIGAVVFGGVCVTVLSSTGW